MYIYLFLCTYACLRARVSTRVCVCGCVYTTVCVYAYVSVGLSYALWACLKIIYHQWLMIKQIKIEQTTRQARWVYSDGLVHGLEDLFTRILPAEHFVWTSNATEMQNTRNPKNRVCSAKQRVFPRWVYMWGSLGCQPRKDKIHRLLCNHTHISWLGALCELVMTLTRTVMKRNSATKNLVTSPQKFFQTLCFSGIWITRMKFGIDYARTSFNLEWIMPGHHFMNISFPISNSSWWGRANSPVHVASRLLSVASQYFSSLSPTYLEDDGGQDACQCLCQQGRQVDIKSMTRIGTNDSKTRPERSVVSRVHGFFHWMSWNPRTSPRCYCRSTCMKRKFLSVSGNSFFPRFYVFMCQLSFIWLGSLQHVPPPHVTRVPWHIWMFVYTTTICLRSRIRRHIGWMRLWSNLRRLWRPQLRMAVISRERPGMRSILMFSTHPVYSIQKKRVANEDCFYYYS